MNFGNLIYLYRNTEGQIRVYNNLPWKKQALFRLQPLVDWFWPAAYNQKRKGGQFKKAGKLTFVTIDEAGHTSPGDQPESVSFVVGCWLKGLETASCPKYFLD